MAAIEITEKPTEVVASAAAVVIDLLREQPFAVYAEIELDEMRRGVATRKRLRENDMLLRAQFARLEECRRALDPNAVTPTDALVAQIADDVHLYRYSDGWARDVVDGWLVTVATELQQRQGLGLLEASRLVYEALTGKLGSEVH